MSLRNLSPLYATPGRAPSMSLGDHSSSVLFSGIQVGDQFCLGTIRADYNARPALHLHEREDETFYILNGRFEFSVGGDILTADVGDTVFAPRHIVHTWKCISPEGGAFLGIISPGGFEGALAEMAGLMAQGPAALAEAPAVFARYGVHFDIAHTPSEKISLAEPVVTRAGAGPMIDGGDHVSRVLLSQEQTGGLFSLLGVVADYEGGVPPHVHTREDETFYVLDGQFSFVAGGQLSLAGPGDAVFAPREIPHTWKCISPEGGRAVLLVTPGGFEQFLTEIQAYMPPRRRPSSA